MSCRCSFGVLFVACLFIASLAGCRCNPPGEQIPRVSGLTDEQVLEVLAQRAEQVERVMSAGTMRIETEDGDSFNLDIALLASGDQQLRLRAWKLGRAVFDLTRDGDDLRLWHAEQDDADNAPPVPNVEQLSMGWRITSGQVFAETPARLETGNPLIATYLISENTTDSAFARLMIDRETQTVTHIEVFDAEQRTRAFYEPNRYRLIDGVPWPTQLALRSKGLSLEITLDDIELNGELPSSAFTPPRDARKLP